MSERCDKSATSILRLGHAQVDVTPPVGIYHRMWGAARHDKATGVHRPLLADVLIVEPQIESRGETGSGSGRFVRILLDSVYLTNKQTEPMIQRVAELTHADPRRVVVTHSHTHAAGHFEPGRRSLPGGELIDGYLEELASKTSAAAELALASVDEATITYSTARCNMAANRDYWDDEGQRYLTGYNPGAPADDTVLVARVTDREDKPRLVIVNYACHPTTLSWDNTLLSPDFVGAAREVVQQEVGAPCCFFQAPCGELGPREGFVGDPNVADRNGRQLGHAALSGLYSMGPPRNDFVFQGAVESGTAIGTWAWAPFDTQRAAQACGYGGDAFVVDLPIIDLPNPVDLQADLERFTAEEQQAHDRGDANLAGDLRAHAERCRRWLARLNALPTTGVFPYNASAYRLGDAIWITCSAEPYSTVQTILRARFPEVALMISPVAGDAQIAYLLPRASYGIGVYQEQPSSLAAGCLETLIEALSSYVAQLTGEDPVS
jgi:hypothetical protein